MDGKRFDHLARRLASRRVFLGLVPAAIAGVLRPFSAAAAPSLTISPNPVRGLVPLKISVAGFRPFEVVRVRVVLNSSTETVIAVIPVSSMGKGSATLPGIAAGGTFTFRARGASGRTAETTLTVTPNLVIQPSPYFHDTIDASGFLVAWRSTREFTIRWYRTNSSSSRSSIVGYGETDGSGGGASRLVFRNPPSVGAHRVEARSATGNLIVATTVTITCRPEQEMNGFGGCCTKFANQCGNGDECCSGYCSPTTGKCVKPNGAACVIALDCMTENCVGGVCTPKPLIDREQTCWRNNGCCSNRCEGFCICAPNGTTPICSDYWRSCCSGAIDSSGQCCTPLNQKSPDGRCCAGTYLDQDDYCRCQSSGDQCYGYCCNGCNPATDTCY